MLLFPPRHCHHHHICHRNRCNCLICITSCSSTRAPSLSLLPPPMCHFLRQSSNLLTTSHHHCHCFSTTTADATPTAIVIEQCCCRYFHRHPSNPLCLFLLTAVLLRVVLKLKLNHMAFLGISQNMDIIPLFWNVQIIPNRTLFRNLIPVGSYSWECNRRCECCIPGNCLNIFSSTYF